MQYFKINPAITELLDEELSLDERIKLRTHTSQEISQDFLKKVLATQNFDALRTVVETVIKRKNDQEARLLIEDYEQIKPFLSDEHVTGLASLWGSSPSNKSLTLIDFLNDSLDSCSVLKSVDTARALLKNVNFGNSSEYEKAAECFIELGDDVGLTGVVSGLCDRSESSGFDNALKYARIVKDENVLAGFVREFLPKALSSKIYHNFNVGDLVVDLAYLAGLETDLVEQLNKEFCLNKKGRRNLLSAYLRLRESGNDVFDENIKNLALDCIFDSHNFLPENNLFNKARKVVNIDTEKILERTDEYISSLIAEWSMSGDPFSERDMYKTRVFDATDIDFLMTQFYLISGLSYEESWSRIGDLARKQGDYHRALSSYNKAKDEKKKYELGLECVKKEDYLAANHVFSNTCLNDLITDDEDFYDFIADTIFSFYLTLDNVNSEKVKEIIHKRFKNEIVKSITPEYDRKGNLELRIDFDNYRFWYTSNRIRYSSRNDNSGIVKSGSPKIFSFLKRNNDCTGLVEGFWLKFLESNGIPVKKFQSGSRNHILTDYCKGGNFLEALPEISSEQVELLYRQGISLAYRIFDVIKSDEDVVKRFLSILGVDYRLTPELINEKFERFYSFMERVGRKSLCDSLKSRQRGITEFLMDSREGIVPNDYGVHNFMLENGILIPVDHEHYLEGNRNAPVVSLLTFPTSHDMIHLTPQMDSDLRNALETYWSARLAGSIGNGKGYANPEARKIADWFAQNVERLTL